MTSEQVSQHPGIQQFKKILVGDLDNRLQVFEERYRGQQIHPLAKHVTRECTHRVHHQPDDVGGIFILEESYYTYPDKETEIKPLLFYIEPHGDRSVLLHSMQVPDRMDIKTFVNANDGWQLDYRELRESERFRPALYQWHDAGFFTVFHPNELGNGMRFTLIEKLTPDCLYVMELLEKDGQRLTPYATPLQYRPIRSKRQLTMTWPPGTQREWSEKAGNPTTATSSNRQRTATFSDGIQISIGISADEGTSWVRLYDSQGLELVDLPGQPFDWSPDDEQLTFQLTPDGDCYTIYFREATDPVPFP